MSVASDKIIERFTGNPKKAAFMSGSTTDINSEMDSCSNLFPFIIALEDRLAHTKFYFDCWIPWCFPKSASIWKQFQVLLDIALIKLIKPMENDYKRKSILFLKNLT